MFNAVERIAYLSKMSKANGNLRFKDLYKTVQRIEFLTLAYQEIKGNKGSKTPGVDKVTKEDLENGREVLLIENISKSLYSQSYTPLPVRRVEISKGFGKSGTRPLGIPALRDRIVQSAIKIILEAIYEEVFLESSHGFRPNHACQTAIAQIYSRKYDWIIEGDIKGCFDNIKHGKLLDVLRKKIADERFINLINKFLKSGYQVGFGTDGKVPIFETNDGTPQGGIVSPVLANVYLHEFDVFMKSKQHDKDFEYTKRSTEYVYYNKRVGKLNNIIAEGKYPQKLRFKAESDNEKKTRTIANVDEAEKVIEEFKAINKEIPYYIFTPEKKINPEKRWYNNKLQVIKRAIEKNVFPYEMWLTEDVHGESLEIESREQAVELLREMKKKRSKTPWEDRDSYWENTTLGHVRYADDFVVLMGGYHKEDAKTLKEEITEWFNLNLGLEINKDKTNITHAAEPIKFVGYMLKKIPTEKGLFRPHAQIYVPNEAKTRVKAKIERVIKKYWNSETFDLFQALNRVISGWSNYYHIANNWCTVSADLDHWVYWKIANHLAYKNKCPIPPILKKYLGRRVVEGKNRKWFIAAAGKTEMILKQFNQFNYVYPTVIAGQILDGDGNEAWYSSPIDESVEKLVMAVTNGSGSFASYTELRDEKGHVCAICGEHKESLIVHHTRMIKRNRRKDPLAKQQSNRDLPKILVCKDCEKKVHPTYQITRQG
jgi:Retron-type reverse transcriptase